jgi:sterol desaturase/sphingolipid hydroxylase (fatty acid hydroxylase superfamily)
MPQSLLRLAAFLAGLFAFLSWEVIAPHHPPTVSKPRRWLVNLSLAVLNGGLVSLLCTACYVVATRRLLPWRLGPLESLGLSPWLRLPAEVILLDLLTYWLHRAYHRLPVLWRFHRVHHTDLDLDVSSASRFHFGEVAVSSAAKLGTIALLGISFPGLVSFEVLLLLAAQLQHANVRLPPRAERALWWTFVPPAMHRVHHAPERAHTDSNYGTLLVAWDRLFGTLRRHPAGPPFGLAEWREPRLLGLARLLLLPFRRSSADAPPPS